MKPASAGDQWGRARLVRTLVGVVLAALTLLGGLVYAAYSAVAVTGTPPRSPAQQLLGAQQLAPGPTRRDAIAAAPMLAVPPQAGRAGIVSEQRAAGIGIPPADRAGPEQVPTGFPHTPQGAIAQLAALEITVLQGMSIDRAHRVYAAWSAPGGVGAAAWELTGDVAAFLSSAAGRHVGEPNTVLVATPVAAQVKGVDGPDWVLACVLLDVQARVMAQAQIAYGHCERMQWSSQDGGRWVIGPGTAPARAPSTWPGTDLAIQAGWKTWTSTAS